jgi:hypothetical protein
MTDIFVGTMKHGTDNTQVFVDHSGSVLLRAVEADGRNPIPGESWVYVDLDQLADIIEQAIKVRDSVCDKVTLIRRKSYDKRKTTVTINTRD